MDDKGSTVGGRVKLLIADDEENARNGLARYVEANSRVVGKVYVAGDGQEALDAILRHHPDVVVIDVRMPLMSGLDVIREAQRAGVSPNVIVLSGYDEFRYAQQAIRLGVSDYLLKPFRPTDLLPMIERLAGAGDGERRHGLVHMACDYIDEHYMEDLSLKVVAGYVGITPTYLSTLFTQCLGQGFVSRLNAVRVQRACAYLRDRRMKTYEVAFKVGFHDEKYFTKVFKKVMGVAPAQYRKEAGD
jgi:two-component system response regulator YesN